MFPAFALFASLSIVMILQVLSRNEILLYAPFFFWLIPYLQNRLRSISYSPNAHCIFVMLTICSKTECNLYLFVSLFQPSARIPNSMYKIYTVNNIVPTRKVRYRLRNLLGVIHSIQQSSSPYSLVVCRTASCRINILSKVNILFAVASDNETCNGSIPTVSFTVFSVCKRRQE